MRYESQSCSVDGSLNDRYLCLTDLRLRGQDIALQVAQVDCLLIYAGTVATKWALQNGR